MASTDGKVRIGIYGCGSWANSTHIPNLLKLDGVEIVAICDSNPQSIKSTAETFNISKTYRNGHEMMDNEKMDALYSVVPAYARTDVEATAAAKGIHIFSEKPQALTMEVAHKIDDAIRGSRRDQHCLFPGTVSPHFSGSPQTSGGTENCPCPIPECQRTPRTAIRSAKGFLVV